MTPTGIWYLVESIKSSSIPPQVLEGVRKDEVRTEDFSSVPIILMEQWGYRLTPVRLVPAAEDWKIRWSNERIHHYVKDYPHLWEVDGVIEMAQEIRDEYEAERKNKIFIPIELRGCILSNIQKSKNFLAEIVAGIEERFPEEERRVHAIQRQIDEWKAELAEYDEVLKVLVGEEDGKEKSIPE